MHRFVTCLFLTGFPILEGTGVLCPMGRGKQYFGYQEVSSTNKYSWTKAANGIWVDAPGSTGFSEGPLETTFEGWVNNLYTFLSEFLKKHPDLNRKLYLAVGSFDATIVGMLAAKIIELKAPINLKGILLMSGISGPLDVYHGCLLKAVERKLVNRDTYDQMIKAFPKCEEAISKCRPASPGGMPSRDDCKAARELCDGIFLVPVVNAGHSVYDVRTAPGEEKTMFKFKTGNAKVFFNLPDVQKALGVSKQWTFQNKEVTNAYDMYALYNTTSAITLSLDAGLAVLVVHGEHDYITNAEGAPIWMSRLAGRFPYGKQLNKAKMTPLKVGGAVIGTAKLTNFLNHARFGFVKLDGSGHAISRCQPLPLQQLAQMFMIGGI
ncbi:hypothetical protein FOL47_004875 [Perkinsus chesapeaki]|uniref:Thymus-specific serine protease n=1 Tax=Perkinsus chesapeaki TaxID=330153 RepID=A0A7J6M046_PERCH|nr:hypothetical protein FOL47_004875 [Perkinsus chesapeaki]